MNHVDNTAPTIVSICRGVGMLDEAIKILFPGARILCSAEWEAYANAAILARMEEKSMDPHPIWFGDIGGLQLTHLLGLVDFFIAGLPWESYSQAGLQKGNDDHRAWGECGGGPVPNAIRLISECLPTVAFFENVPAWVRSSDQHFRPFGEALCRLGYTLVEPVFVRARTVGASHARERVFVLAYRPGRRFRMLRQSPGSSGFFDWYGSGLGHAASGQLQEEGRGSDKRNDRSGRSGEDLADAEHMPGSSKLVTETGRREDSQPEQDPMLGGSGTGNLAHADSAGNPGRSAIGGATQGSGTHDQSTGSSEGLADAQHGQRREHGNAGEERSEVRKAATRRSSKLADTGKPGSQGRKLRGTSAGGDRPEASRSTAELRTVPVFAPGPSDRESWAGIIANTPYLAPAIEPGFCVLFDGLAYVVDESRADQLRCSGNGVVPSQAALGLFLLLKRAGLL